MDPAPIHQLQETLSYLRKIDTYSSIFPWKHQLRESLDVAGINLGYCVLDYSDDYRLSMAKGDTFVRMVGPPPEDRASFVDDVQLCLSALGLCGPPPSGRVPNITVCRDPRLSAPLRCGSSILRKTWSNVGYKLILELIVPSGRWITVCTSCEREEGHFWAQVECLRQVGVPIPPEVQDEADVASMVCLVGEYPVGCLVGGGWTWLAR